MKALYTALAAATLALASCSVPAGWSVDGAVEDAPQGTRLALENFSNGRWLLVDSLDVNADGAFGYDAPAAAGYAELMRLTLTGKGSIYFPVDSIDNILIETTYANFGNARVTGTPAADAFTAVDSIIAAHGRTLSPELQRELANVVAQDTTGIVAYYIVSKSIDGNPIFDNTDSFGNRVYGAASQVFARHYPNDPRGLALRRAYFEGRRALGHLPEGADSVITVPETGVIDIVRYDSDGNRHSLAELAGQNKVIILNFTLYGHPNSPVFNAALHELYERYHNLGLEIYQIAFDDNEVEWKAAARNIPWIAVWNSINDGDAVLRAYNVGDVPVSFVINRNGDICSRIVGSDGLTEAVSAQF